ncbi:MAG: FHA domain-containing protein [Bdellovibrionota bacterium]
MAIKLDIISLAVDADMNPVVKEFRKDKIVIGRGKNVDLNLEKDDVSSKHATIYVNDDNTLSIEDMGSLNGTTVGDTKIQAQKKYTLKQKDRIMIGDYLIKASFIEDELVENELGENELGEDELVEEEFLEEKITEETSRGKNLESLDVLEKRANANTNNNANNNAEDITNTTNEMIEDYELENILSNSDILTEDIPTIDDNIFELEDDFSKEELFSDDLEDKAKDYETTNTTKEENILSSQEKLVLEDKKEINILNNKNNNKDNNKDASKENLTNINNNDGVFLIISGTANDDISDINLEAIKLLTLKGQCKRFGVAIPDVLITLNEEKAITDNNGFFKFDNIEENSPIAIKAEKSGYIFKNKNIPTTLAEDSSIIFEGIKTCHITGKIIYKGKGLEGVEITNNLGKNVITSKDGSFFIKDIEEGRNYTIKPLKENFIFDFDDTQRTLKEDTTFVINATKLISISGYIKYKGVPIADVIVDAGELGKTITDKNGFYEFKNIKEGTQYSLKAYKEGFKFQKA